MIRIERIASIFLVFLAAYGSSASAAFAAVFCKDVPRLQRHQSMQFCMRTDIYIAAVGEITTETPRAFVEFLEIVDANGLRPHSVTFHSDGGSLGGGILLGKVIRRLKLDTHVGESSTCASACMLAFIGGWSRKVTHDGRIGNHQFKNVGSEFARVQTVQDLISLLTEYHVEMQVSPLAITAAMSRRADEIYWYSPQERREWGITTRR